MTDDSAQTITHGQMFLIGCVIAIFSTIFAVPMMLSGTGKDRPAADTSAATAQARKDAPRLQLDADLAVRGSKVVSTTDQEQRNRYVAALSTWTDEQRHGQWCDEKGFVKPASDSDRFETEYYLKCFTAGPYVVTDDGWRSSYFYVRPQSSTRLDPYETNVDHFRYLDINALVKAAE